MAIELERERQEVELHVGEDMELMFAGEVVVGECGEVPVDVAGDDVLIGMKAVVMNGARVGRGSIVAVGALVTEGMVIPPNSVVMGSPAVTGRPSGRVSEEWSPSAAKRAARASITPASSGCNVER